MADKEKRSPNQPKKVKMNEEDRQIVKCVGVVSGKFNECCICSPEGWIDQNQSLHLQRRSNSGWDVVFFSPAPPCSHLDPFRFRFSSTVSHTVQETPPGLGFSFLPPLSSSHSIRVVGQPKSYHYKSAYYYVIHSTLYSLSLTSFIFGRSKLHRDNSENIK